MRQNTGKQAGSPFSLCQGLCRRRKHINSHIPTTRPKSARGKWNLCQSTKAQQAQPRSKNLVGQERQTDSCSMLLVSFACPVGKASKSLKWPKQSWNRFNLEVIYKDSGEATNTAGPVHQQSTVARSFFP